MKLYWFNKLCCVPGCYNSSTEGEGCFKEYFDLPAQPLARSKWLTTILVEDGENLKVCEDHFKRLGGNEDIFLDKSNRKKLRLNSAPSQKLPTHICKLCRGATKSLPNTKDNLDVKSCACFGPPQFPSTPESGSNRKRYKWSGHEKLTLLKSIKECGNLKFSRSRLIINWPKVIDDYRSNGCFGNEKELRIVWQNMRVNATKVYRNKIVGTKLDRKVSRFLYGKPSKKLREIKREIKTAKQESSSDECPDIKNVLKPNNTSAGEENVINSHKMESEPQENYSDPSAVVEQNAEQIQEEPKIEVGVQPEQEEEEESDCYCSLSDVETMFGIRIRSNDISLESSDEDH